MMKRQNSILEWNYENAITKKGHDKGTGLEWKDELFREDEYYVLRQYYNGKVVMKTEDVTELYL
jgi:hypothetical protein